jgi:hypothetical protein
VGDSESGCTNKQAHRMYFSGPDVCVERRQFEIASGVWGGTCAVAFLRPKFDILAKMMDILSYHRGGLRIHHDVPVVRVATGTKCNTCVQNLSMYNLTILCCQGRHWRHSA